MEEGQNNSKIEMDDDAHTTWDYICLDIIIHVFTDMRHRIPMFVLNSFVKF